VLNGRAQRLAVGGEGNDTFVFEKGSGTDTITDFHVTTSSAARRPAELSGYGQGAYLTHSATSGRCITTAAPTRWHIPA